MTSTRNENKVLKEFTFFLPECTPDGEPDLDVHDELVAELTTNFSRVVTTLGQSLTMTEIDERPVTDDVTIYSIFCQDSRAAMDTLIALFKKAAADLDQEFVIFKKPNGEVFYLDV